MDTTAVQASGVSARRVKCTGLDAVLSYNQLQFVWLFRERLEHAALLAALPGLIERLPALAGELELRDGKLFINCSNRGVPVAVRQRPETLEHWATQFDRLRFAQMAIHNVPPGARSPLFRVRITQFAGGGSALGVSFNHALADMASFASVMKAWCDEAWGRSRTSAVQVDDRPGFLAQRLDAAAGGSATLRLLGIRETVRTFCRFLAQLATRRQVMCHFTAREVAAMRAAMSKACGTHIWPQTAALAHMLSVLFKVEPGLTRRLAFIPMSFRQHTDVSDAVLGNMVSHLRLLCTAEQSAAEIAVQLVKQMAHFSELHDDYLPNERSIAGAGRVSCRSDSPRPAAC